MAEQGKKGPGGNPDTDGEGFNNVGSPKEGGENAEQFGRMTKDDIREAFDVPDGSKTEVVEAAVDSASKKDIDAARENKDARLDEVQKTS